MSQRERITAAVALGAAVVWQTYAAVLAFVYPRAFRDLYTGLGATLPLVTRAFLATYVVWPVVPIVSALLAVDLLRRDQPSLAHYLAVLVGTFAAALVLHAWLHEATFAPMFSLIKAIG